MKLQNFLKTLGPGILFASAAIGVSHLVQSTRAGATYGFLLVGAVLLANVIKFPFFEFGSRYAVSTGTSLLAGYRKVGRWAVYVYLFITLGSMFAVTAAVSFVCAGILNNLLGLSISMANMTGLLFLAVVVLLLIGRFNALDGLMKVVSIFLLLSTVAVFVLTMIHGPVVDHRAVEAPGFWEHSTLAFTIALMGWMPTAVDLSVWNSLWTLARIRQTGYRPSVREVLIEFRIGYLISAVLALCFLALGAYMMYGTGTEFSGSAVEFADQIVSLYTFSLGEEFRWVIALSAFTVMLSTTVTVFDGYARTLREISLQLREKPLPRQFDPVFLLVLAGGSYLIIFAFVTSLKSLVDFATTLSFVFAPVIAYLNLRAMTGEEVTGDGRLSRGWRIYGWVGVVLLSLFSASFLIWMWT